MQRAAEFGGDIEAGGGEEAVVERRFKGVNGAARAVAVHIRRRCDADGLAVVDGGEATLERGPRGETALFRRQRRRGRRATGPSGPPQLRGRRETVETMETSEPSGRYSQPK